MVCNLSELCITHKKHNVAKEKQIMTRASVSLSPSPSLSLWLFIARLRLPPLWLFMCFKNNNKNRRLLPLTQGPEKNQTPNILQFSSVASLRGSPSGGPPPWGPRGFSLVPFLLPSLS